VNDQPQGEQPEHIDDTLQLGEVGVPAEPSQAREPAQSIETPFEPPFVPPSPAPAAAEAGAGAPSQARPMQPPQPPAGPPIGPQPQVAPLHQGPFTGPQPTRQPGPMGPGPGQQPWGAAYSQAGPGQPRPGQRVERSRVPGWLWPVVCGLALVLGLVGGLIGGLTVSSFDDDSGPGQVSDGLAGVDTVSTPPLNADNGSVAAVAEKLLPSTVQILAGDATGSGWVLDKQGHIVTNNHVVADAAEDGKIQFVDNSGKRYDASIVGRSPVYDLAILYAKDAKKIAPVSMGASNAMHVGDGVVAIGSPLGLTSTVTYGIISALNRPVTTGGADASSFINAVQTDAAINPGNSGGPLVNMRGQVVGVNSAIATTGGTLGGESGNIGVGFAIPIEQVKVTANQILADGEARYPVIGAKVETGESDGKGAVVDSVVADAPADKAGVKKDDLITAIDGKTVIDGIGLIVAIRTHVPGEVIELTIDRDGDEKKVKVTLGAEVG
jgi:putative serine protease PepD